MTKLEHLKELLSLWEQPDYRYRQIMEAVFRKRISKFSEMKSLPASLRQRLTEVLGDEVLSLRAVKRQSARQAEKVLFALPGDGPSTGHVEAVRLHYRQGWSSYCISSQSGCAFGCRFCATGAMGLYRNLTAWEIAEQLLYFRLQGHELDSVSFMGMGEPFANPQLFQALELLTSPLFFGLSQRRITVSTVGVLPGIRRLTAQWPQVNLAFSLHAPTPELRKRLMSVERRWPMEQVLDTVDAHIRKTNKRVFLAYTLLRDFNDSPAHARKLISLLRSRKRTFPLYHIDLIPYNETGRTGALFHAPESSRVRDFEKLLRQAELHCSVRTQFGADISAACGQLYAEETLE